ncbi:hypothetical protein GGF46_004686 [Coemansia sp. RSA 552]|nr:hypothetical protein GGF46_004686 [Coemansia sp. RSA 552]
MALQASGDCATTRYCTDTGETLGYGGQYVVKWNNQYPPLNTESQVTVSVYSQYDLTKPVFQVAQSNINGMATLTPSPEWFERYQGTDDEAGRQQMLYFSVSLRGNDPPPVSSMLQLQLEATPEQYAEIKQVLHPELSSSDDKSSDDKSSEATSSMSEVSSTESAMSSTESADSSDMSSLSPALTASTETLTLEDSSGLSGGAIAGIVVGSVAAGLLLLLALILFILWRRRVRRRQVLARSAAMEDGDATRSSGAVGSQPGGGSDVGLVAAAAAARVTGEKAPSDTALLMGGRPSSGSHEDSVVDSQLSPRTAVYQPLNLDSPRVMMNMPPSTRSSQRDLRTDPILSTDDARQIGDIFRDALRKPPPVSEDGTGEDGNHRASMMHVDDDGDDELLEGEDPGWRERVASERMQRELEQEASVIRSVAMRAHGSDYSSSRPPTSQSET